MFIHHVFITGCSDRGAWTGCTKSICCCHNHCDGAGCFNITMVTGNGIDDNRVFFILASQLCSDFHVAAIHFSVNGFSNIM